MAPLQGFAGSAKWNRAGWRSWQATSLAILSLRETPRRSQL
jgi:hypothetical protein